MEGDGDPTSLPVADHEQDGYIMVDLKEIVSHMIPPPTASHHCDMTVS